MTRRNVEPRIRGIAVILAIGGTLITTKPLLLLAFFTCVVIPLVLASHLSRQILLFTATVIVPIFIGLYLIWGLIVGAPPGGAPHSSVRDAIEFAATIALRLLLIGSIAQLGLGSIQTEDIPYVLSKWGFRGAGLFIAMGSLTMWPELMLRASQIHTAACARGLVRSSPLGRVRQFPYMVRGLVAWSLRSSLDRSTMWRQRDLLKQESIGDWKFADGQDDRRYMINVAILTVATTWFVLAIASRLGWDPHLGGPAHMFGRYPR